MDEPNLLQDVHYMRDVIERTQRPQVNRFWPVTLSWGCVITAGYIICEVLAQKGDFAALPWVFPLLICMVAYPLQWVLIRRIRRRVAQEGVRPRMRKDLAICWCGITAVGLLWTAAIVISPTLHANWYLLGFLWATLYFVGYLINGVLISPEWLWAAGVLLVSLVAIYLAGPAFYWLPGLWMGVTLILAGVMGRQKERRLAAAAAA